MCVPCSCRIGCGHCADDGEVVYRLCSSVQMYSSGYRDRAGYMYVYMPSERVKWNAINENGVRRFTTAIWLMKDQRLGLPGTLHSMFPFLAELWYCLAYPRTYIVVAIHDRIINLSGYLKVVVLCVSYVECIQFSTFSAWLCTVRPSSNNTTNSWTIRRAITSWAYFLRRNMHAK